MSDTKITPKNDSQGEKNGVTRRDFIKNAAVGGAGFMIVPRHVLGRGMTPPSDLLNIAGVGIGGMGRSNLIALASQNITALCDVDWDYAGKSFERLGTDIEHLQTRVNQAPAGGQAQSQTRSGLNSSTPEQQLANMKRLYTEHWQKAKRYKDYREMLEKQKDIDAVVVATSDHMHTPIALAAMELGKHVYVQKPLTWSVAEARALAKKAKETKVATQMGNQGHSSDEARLSVEYVQSGAIGEVREIHVWTNRPLGFWPQGIPRPEALTVPAPTIPSIIRLIGADGWTGAAARLVTWVRTCSTSLSGRSNSACQPASKPFALPSTKSLSRTPRKPSSSSLHAAKCRPSA